MIEPAARPRETAAGFLEVGATGDGGPAITSKRAMGPRAAPGVVGVGGRRARAHGATRRPDPGVLVLVVSVVVLLSRRLGLPERMLAGEVVGEIRDRAGDAPVLGSARCLDAWRRSWAR
jgi:hypothetical protein